MAYLPASVLGNLLGALEDALLLRRTCSNVVFLVEGGFVLDLLRRLPGRDGEAFNIVVPFLRLQ